MTLTEQELRDTLTGHVQEVPGNADRLGEVHGRIRRTHRRRQTAASGVLALAVAGVAIGLTVPGSGHHASVVPSQPAATYGTAVLAGPGPVLLDATTGRTSTGHGGTALGLSRDGRYVASSLDDGTRVEVTDRDGHVLLSEPTGTEAAAWSPTADLLAVVGTSATATLTVYDVSAAGTRVVARTVVGAADPTPALAWSENGSRLAVGSGQILTTVSASGKVLGQKTFSAGEHPAPAAWSGDGSHLAVFVHSGSASLDADGVQVVDLDTSGQQVGTLPESLAYPDWWRALPGTDVLGTVGAARSVDAGKSVVRCDLATARCATLAGGATASAFGAVPTATGIAYLRAVGPQDGAAGPVPSPPVLMLAAADGSDAHPAPGAPREVEQIVAAPGSAALLLVGSGAAGPGVYRYAGGNATRLAAVPAPATRGYYGHVTELVAWIQPTS